MLCHTLAAAAAVLRRVRHGFPTADHPALDAAVGAMERAATHLRPTGCTETDAFGPGPAPLSLHHDLEVAHVQLELVRKLDPKHGAAAALERRDAAREAQRAIREALDLLRTLEPVRRSA